MDWDVGVISRVGKEKVTFGLLTWIVVRCHRLRIRFVLTRARSSERGKRHPLVALWCHAWEWKKEPECSGYDSLRDRNCRRKI